MTKNVLIVTPLFLPSNVAGVHRSRIISRHLKKYGWHPHILIVDHLQHPGNVDLNLEQLIPEDITIEKTQAFPLAISKLIGLNDPSIRGLPHMIKRASRLVRQKKIDLIYVTILPAYAAWVGRTIKRRFNVPFVLDYQDPWVYRKDRPKNIFSKSTIAHWLSVMLEKRVLKYTDALSAVSMGTLDSIKERNLLDDHKLLQVFPIGVDAEDIRVSVAKGHSHLKQDREVTKLLYMGTITKEMLPTLEVLLEALVQINNEESEEYILSLIGTSANIGGEDPLGLDAIISEKGARDYVTHQPERVNYLDSLKTMSEADALFLIGTNEPHYTASKVFPYWLAGPPIVGVFHQQSEIVRLSEKIGGVRLITYHDHIKEKDRLVSETLKLYRQLTKEPGALVPTKSQEEFGRYEADALAKEHALFFDKVVKHASAQ